MCFKGNIYHNFPGQLKMYSHPDHKLIGRTDSKTDCSAGDTGKDEHFTDVSCSETQIIALKGR